VTSDTYQKNTHQGSSGTRHTRPRKVTETRKDMESSHRSGPTAIPCSLHWQVSKQLPSLTADNLNIGRLLRHFARINGKRRGDVSKAKRIRLQANYSLHVTHFLAGVVSALASRLRLILEMLVTNIHRRVRKLPPQCRDCDTQQRRTYTLNIRTRNLSVVVDG
jgi:exosome complex RNA-binding protein Csl4